MKKTNLSGGIIFIGLGFFFLFYNLFEFNFSSIALLWPMLIFFMGLFFEWEYLSKKKTPGLLVPGGIFLILGVLFEFEILTHWSYAEYTWPLYPFAVAFGLFQLYLFTDRPRPLLIPILILSGVPILTYLALFFSTLSTLINFGIVIPLLLILLGILILFRS